MFDDDDCRIGEATGSAPRGVDIQNVVIRKLLAAILFRAHWCAAQLPRIKARALVWVFAVTQCFDGLNGECQLVGQYIFASGIGQGILRQIRVNSGVIIARQPE